MHRSILFIVVLLTVIYLLGIPGAQNLIAMAAAGYLLFVGVRWMVQQRLDGRSVAMNFLALLFGASILVMLLNIAHGWLRSVDVRLASLAILIGLLLAGWFIPQIWRKKKR